MPVRGGSAIRLLTLVCAIALLQSSGTVAIAQQPNQQVDVVKVSTELVQTAITVVDKDGRFVDGLTRDQFQLTIDGQPRPISFFERVTAGSPREAQVNSTLNRSSAANSAPSSSADSRGRTIVFFIDDMHMSADSLHRSRDMLRRFLSDEMSSLDSVVIATASGQVGFLQQFTNNKQVLSAAVERLTPRQYEVRSFGTGNTQMREFDALIIDTTESRKANSEVLNYYIRECVVQSPRPRNIPVAIAAIAATCETEVRNSARAVLIQTAKITQNMYASLESLMRSATRAPGRKLAFFISDGFLLDDGPHAPDLRGKLDNIIDAAQKAGVVVYTIDSRGLANEGVNMRQGHVRMDFGAPIGETEARQDAMNALAGDTGGRALRNMNFFDRWVGKVLDETSNYYVIAWRPDTDAEKLPRFRHVQVSIVNRPELSVRAPRGYVAGPNAAQLADAERKQKSAANPAPKTGESDLRDALTDYYPNHSLPTLLSLTYLNTPKNEMLLTSSVQISTPVLKYGNDGKQRATVKLAGVVLNDKGKIAASFKNQLSVDSTAGQSENGSVIYNERTPLAPGIYQVRVAARDENSGIVGSAMQWIVIPDLTTRRLNLSSVLFVAEVLENSSGKDAAPQVQFLVDRRFPHPSSLGYWIFVYNAKRDASGAPNLTVKSEIWRDGQLVTTAPPRIIKNGSPDPDRIPFANRFPVGTLSRGRYELVVTIIDNVSAATATQTIDFDVS